MLDVKPAINETNIMRLTYTTKTKLIWEKKGPQNPIHCF